MIIYYSFWPLAFKYINIKYSSVNIALKEERKFYGQD